MKKLLLGNVALMALTIGSATAADLSSAKPRPMLTKAPVMAPVYNWSGFYLGLNGGYSWGRSSTDFTITGVPAGSTSENMNGWLGGGQIGYNWQMQTFVFGLEADIQATGQKGTFNFSTPTVCPPPGALALPCVTGNGSVEQKLPWFGTLRGRLGVTPMASWLLYVTGGLAYGEVDTNATFTTATAFAGGPVIASVSTSASSSTTRTGWVVGGGAEWAISGPWTAKIEYLFMDLGTVSNSFAGLGPFTLVNTSSRITDNIVRVGVNYRLGGASY
jgi:outer membrane immunogenic protein